MVQHPCNHVSPLIGSLPVAPIDLPRVRKVHDSIWRAKHETAARTNQVIGARWEEFDQEKKTGAIPTERMKAGKEHTVPLSKRVKKILMAMEQVTKIAFEVPRAKVTWPKATWPCVPRISE